MSNTNKSFLYGYLTPFEILTKAITAFLYLMLIKMNYTEMKTAVNKI